MREVFSSAFENLCNRKIVKMEKKIGKITRDFSNLWRKLNFGSAEHNDKFTSADSILKVHKSCALSQSVSLSLSLSLGFALLEACSEMANSIKKTPINIHRQMKRRRRRRRRREKIERIESWTAEEEKWLAFPNKRKRRRPNTQYVTKCVLRIQCTKYKAMCFPWIHSVYNARIHTDTEQERASQ